MFVTIVTTVPSVTRSVARRKGCWRPPPSTWSQPPMPSWRRIWSQKPGCIASIASTTSRSVSPSTTNDVSPPVCSLSNCPISTVTAMRLRDVGLVQSELVSEIVQDLVDARARLAVDALVELKVQRPPVDRCAVARVHQLLVQRYELLLVEAQQHFVCTLRCKPARAADLDADRVEDVPDLGVVLSLCALVPLAAENPVVRDLHREV